MTGAEGQEEALDRFLVEQPHERSTRITLLALLNASWAMPSAAIEFEPNWLRVQEYTAPVLHCP